MKKIGVFVLVVSAFLGAPAALAGGVFAGSGFALSTSIAGGFSALPGGGSSYSSSYAGGTSYSNGRISYSNAVAHTVAYANSGYSATAPASRPGAFPQASNVSAYSSSVAYSSPSPRARR